ncbi:MAG: FUSC family protein [Azovibrio sp.]
MFKFKWADLHFSAVTFCAAMLALYLSMSIDLQQPYWAMMTVYIVSQPLAAAVRSKAIYRLLGTFFGASVAVVMVPRLANSPVILCLAMAFWVGGCLAISMLDRSPRSYMMMLAGYTVAIIGFSSVSNPEGIFNLAVARTEEIVLGILCATLVHSLWFPRPVGEVIRSRIETWFGDADQWALDILHGNDPAATSQDRVRLAAAASEIHIMATHLPFDTSNLRETTAVVRTLHSQIVMLIPILSSLSDRLAALRREKPDLDRQSNRAITQVSDWIKAGALEEEAAPLIVRLEEISGGVDGRDWYALNQLGLFARLQDVVRMMNQGRMLLKQLHDPLAPLSGALEEIVTTISARPLHRDFGLALLSGATASVAILITCAVWIGLGWAEGGASAMVAAILCCLFAAMDDPAPAIKSFGVSLLIAGPLAATYLFVVFPSIDNFPLLVMALAPTMLTIGMLSLDPRFAAPAMVVLLNFGNSMAIQERMSTDFASFLNTNLSQFFGLLTAIFVTRTLRSMSTDASAQRLLWHTWKSLASLATSKSDDNQAVFTSRMVDRLGLLTPRLAATKDEKLAGMDTLRELRVGMDLFVLKNARAGLSSEARLLVDKLLGAVGTHYSAHTAGIHSSDDQLLSILDQALNMLSSSAPDGRGRALTALVGLRQNLFPLVSFSPSAPSEAAS